MSKDNIDENKKREIIQSALESIDLRNLSPEVTKLIEFFVNLSEDKSFIENLNKEIFSKHGE